MFKWIWHNIENRIEWSLVHEDDEAKIIGFVKATENMDNWKVVAECKEIGYKGILDNVDQKNLKIIMSDIKKFIQEQVTRKNVKLSKKKNYKMVEGIPIWQHLKNGAEENEIRLIATDYGNFAEILGKRVLRRLIRERIILNGIFPFISILSTNRIPKIFKGNGRLYHRGDLALEVHYKDDKGYGKKIVIFEIKHGLFQIEQNQLRRYCFMIKTPGEYFPKANEVKVIFLMFDQIDTMGCSASYSIGELDKNIALKILESTPLTQDELDYEKIIHSDEKTILPELLLGQMISQFEN